MMEHYSAMKRVRLATSNNMDGTGKDYSKLNISQKENDKY